MAQRVKSITAEIGIDSRKFTSGANQIRSKTNAITKDLLGAAAGAIGFTASIAGVATAFKQLYEAAEEGQAIINAEARLAAFAGGAEKATDVIDAMQDSLDGGISRFEAAQQASKLFELGLVDSAESAAELSKNIMATGGNINDFSLMIANESKMRLDLYGLSVADVTKRQEELSAANKDLTSQETFAIAVKEQLAEKTATLEDAGYQAITAYDQLGATFKDATDELKKHIAEGLTPAVEALNLIITFNDKVEKAYVEHSDAVVNVTDNYRDYIIAMLKAKQEAESLSYSQEKLLGALENGVAWTDISAETGLNYVAVLENVADHTGILTKAQYELLKIEKQYINEGDEMVRRYTEQGKATEVVAEAEIELTNVLEEEIAKRNEALTKFNENKLDQIQMFSNIEQNYAEQSASVAEDLAAVQAELALRRSQGYAEWGSTITGLVEKENELIAKAQEVEDAHDKATKSIILGYLEQKLAADGILTDDEVTWLLEKGVEWGIYADNAVAAYQEAQAAADEAMKHFKDKTVTLTVNYATSGNVGLAANVLPTGYTEYMPHANGTQGVMTVPPGFPDDSYMIGLSSGEQYAVASQAQQATTGESPAIEMDYDRMAEAITQALERTGR